MAKMLKQFNAAETEKMGNFTPIPAGVYTAQITNSEMKQTKSGDGHYLQLDFEVIGGDHNGRKVWARLNIDNKNSQTVEIAQKTLATICECCDVDVLDDSEQLHNKPMEINIIERPATAQYPAQNDVKGYTKIEGGPVAAGAGDSGGATPPWKS